jgi:hypothetical protein
MSTNKKAIQKAIAKTKKKKAQSKKAIRKSASLPVSALIIDPETVAALPDDEVIVEESVQVFIKIESIEYSMTSVKWTRS